MNPGMVVKLRPTGPWRIGPDSGARNRVDAIYHSDTLYGAVTSAMAVLGSRDEWLDATARASVPAVSFSSCFPFLDEIGFVPPPRTVWPPSTPALMAARVRWKSARFVPLGIVQAILAGERLDDAHWTVDGPSECLLPVGRLGPFRTGVRWNAAVDRLSGASERHSTACLEFRAGAGLWAIVSYADDAARDRWSGPIKAAFRWLADSGFGGERSRGWGRSEAPEFVEGELPEMILRTEKGAGKQPVEEPVSPPPVEPPPSEEAPPVEQPPSEDEPPVEEPPSAEASVIGRPETSAMVAPPAPEAELPAADTAVPETSGLGKTEPADPPAPDPESQAVVEEPSVTSEPETSPIADAQAPGPEHPAPVAAGSEEALAASEPETSPIADAQAPGDERPARVEAGSEEASATSEPEKSPMAEAQALGDERPARVEEGSEEASATGEPGTSPMADAQAPGDEHPAPAQEGSEEASATSEPETSATAGVPVPRPSAPVAAGTQEPPPTEEAARTGKPGTSATAPGTRPPVPSHAPFWLLSLYTPSSDDAVDWARGNYALMTRGGRVDASGELKKQLPMVAEGSVLYSSSVLRGAAPDVAPDGFAHPVFRAGFALSIPLPEAGQ